MVNGSSTRMQSLGTAQALPGRRVPVGPVEIFDGTARDCLDVISARHDAGLGSRIATANLDFVALARRNPMLADDLAAATMVIADGTPVAWLARLGGGRRVERFAGCDLAEQLLSCIAERQGKVRAAIIGSTEETAAAAIASLQQGDPRLEFDPVICPPFRALRDDEIAAMGDQVSAAAPDVVLVALGCPRQERFMTEHFRWAPRAAWIGIGGSLDFYAGKRRRAPAWAQRAGLEWLIRLGQEPGRLWRRYLVRDVPALIATTPGCLWRGLRGQVAVTQRPLN